MSLFFIAALCLIAVLLAASVAAVVVAFRGERAVARYHAEGF